MIFSLHAGKNFFYCNCLFTSGKWSSKSPVFCVTRQRNWNWKIPVVKILDFTHSACTCKNWYEMPHRALGFKSFFFYFPCNLSPMRSRLAKNALILLSCGQLPVFSTTVLPVANSTRIMIPGSSWPHPPPTTNTRMASSDTPLHESQFLHIHPRTLKTNQGTTLMHPKQGCVEYNALVRNHNYSTRAKPEGCSCGFARVHYTADSLLGVR